MVRNYKRKTIDKWTKADLLDALVNINQAKIKINDAAVKYGISRATLYRQLKKFVQAGGVCDVDLLRSGGGNSILTLMEEKVLVKTAKDLRDQGVSISGNDIKRICFEYCDANGIPNQFNQDRRIASDDWYYGFVKRHPSVRIDDQPVVESPDQENAPVKGKGKKKKKPKKGKRSKNLVEQGPKSSLIVAVKSSVNEIKTSKSKFKAPPSKKAPAKRKAPTASGKGKGRPKKIKKTDPETDVMMQEPKVQATENQETDDILFYFPRTGDEGLESQNQDERGEIDIQ